MLLKNLIVLCCLIAVTFWFYTQNHSSTRTHTNAKPQEYMSDLEIINFDTNGMPKETMQAQYWEFVHAAGHSDLIMPRVSIYKPNGDVWKLSANKAIAWHATMHDEISKVQMHENVLIERPEHNATTHLTIKTEALEYTPNDALVRTKEFVSLEQPGLNISGYGLLGNLDRNWIELHDKINTIYTTQ